jgi:hypothetical protein
MPTKKQIKEIQEKAWKRIESALEQLRSEGCYLVDRDELFETTRSTIWCAVFNK